MKKFLSLAVATVCCLGLTLHAQDPLLRAREMEAGSNPLGARLLLEQTVRDGQGGAAALSTWAEFLDRHGDPEARAVYRELLNQLEPANSEQRAAVLRRLVVLDMLAGDTVSAEEHLDAYREAGGAELDDAQISHEPLDPATSGYLEIPGPLSAFARMIAVAPDNPPETILQAVTHNVATRGYRAAGASGAMQPNEYLKLAVRYLSQARELELLAGDSGTIRVDACESNATQELLRVLGFRIRGGCGGDVILETVSPVRAFLTIDSGFPLAELEESLRTNRPFVHSFEPSRVPMLYDGAFWTAASDTDGDEPLIDMFLGDPALSRLYLSLSQLSPETAEAITGAADQHRLKAFAHVLDFYGSLFEVRDGRAIVPGGELAEQAWQNLVGVSPRRGGEFFVRLAAVDDGWMASFFDSLMRTRGPALEYLTEPSRMERFYQAVRGRVTSPGPARPVFRANADMMLLVTRLPIEADGQPHIPGGLEVWKELFSSRRGRDYDENLSRNAPRWQDADDLLEALFALCRKPVDNEALKIYLGASDIDRRRETPLEPATVRRLIAAVPDREPQFPVFTETGTLSDSTLVAYLDRTDEIQDIGDRMRRSEAAGSMQALVGLWQIFVRNGAIPESEADGALNGIIAAFSPPWNDEAMLDKSLSGLNVLLDAVGRPENLSLQDYFIDLLAGAASPADAETHNLLIEDLIRMFEAQRLVPIDDLTELASHLDALAEGSAQQVNSELVARLAARLDEIPPSRDSLSGNPVDSQANSYWSEAHIQRERDLNLRRGVERAAGNPDRLRELRADLAPLLRDTLVGLNYIYYAPPGSQIILTNPLFVRGHGFLGRFVEQNSWEDTTVAGSGWPRSAGGRLVGSLAGLPYALAQAEQDFLVPDSEQALIWQDLVPQLIVDAKVPRWWNVSSSQLHWLALHLRYGRSALAEAALVPERREELVELLRNQATPARVLSLERYLDAGDLPGAIEYVTPSELFLLARDLLETRESDDVISREIRQLAAEDPDQINYDRIGRLFGSPKPTLSTSYRPDLLNLRTFPTLMRYSSRILAESWESNLLYFADLADELYLRPSQLNLYVPQWTRQTVETIFATNLEDWPAVLRSLRAVGENARGEMSQRWTGVQQALVN